MNEKKKYALSDDELDNVVGGKTIEEIAKYLPKDHGPHIGQYAAGGYVGRKVYLVVDMNPKDYYWGTLVKSEEEKFLLLPFSQRMHTISIDGSTSGESGTIKCWGKTHTLFLYN